MNEKFYVVMCGPNVMAMDEKYLVAADASEAGQLFDDYDQARNAIRRTTRMRKRFGLGSAGFRVQRLVL